MSNFEVFDSIHGKFIVNIHDHFHSTALKQGTTHIEPELQMIYKVVDELDENSVIIDGGTNAGFVLIPLAQRTKNKNIKIIGFEPQRVMHAAVSGSLVLNDLSKNCIIINAGLSDKIGAAHIGLLDYSQHNDFGTVKITTHASGNTAVLCFDDSWINIVTVDHLDLHRLDFMKLDIEGHELFALKGAENTLKKFKPKMWIEHPLVGIQNIRNLLSSFGLNYEVTDMDGSNCLCIPK